MINALDRSSSGEGTKDDVPHSFLTRPTGDNP